MDPLSELLSLLKPQSYVSGGVQLNPDMMIQWPQHAGIKCYAVISGQCWLRVAGISQPVHLTAGDCYLLPPGPAFSLATDLQATTIDFVDARAAGLLGNGRDELLAGGCFLAGGHFMLTGEPAEMLLGSLPTIVHIQKESDKRAMRWSLEHMVAEIRDPQPGSSLITQQLAYMMLIQALRLHLAEGTGQSMGWLFALGDKQISRAIISMHQQPAHPWTLQQLAVQAGMSRSSFALRFKQLVEISPIEYLTHWRMRLASEKLQHATGSIARIALALGYESEGAFGKAFKRVVGCTPGQYRRHNIGTQQV